MILNRRQLLATCGAFGLAACAPLTSAGRSVKSSPALSEFVPEENPSFSVWLERFQARARHAGFSSKTIQSAFANAGYIPGVVSRDRTQIQTRRTLEDYLSITSSEERLRKGRAAYSRHEDTLSAIEARYGVEAQILVAIWGVESQYGEKPGRVPVISSTATLAFDGRRGTFYESQLLAALRILERGETVPLHLVGSWAGAMGHTQFIPTSYLSFAVDFGGDGRRDIWGEDPTDALASTANYLARNGWRSGLRWGFEVGASGSGGRIVQPQRGGAAFQVTRNFDVLKTYNNSDLYAIGVGHLADRIGGAGPLRGSFPADANGLTKSDRLAIQRALAARGYDVGTIDGVIGDMTTDAIRKFQAARGLPVNGTATRELLKQLG